jgi:hypothetical protein
MLVAGLKRERARRGGKASGEELEGRRQRKLDMIKIQER